MTDDWWVWDSAWSDGVHRDIPARLGGAARLTPDEIEHAANACCDAGLSPHDADVVADVLRHLHGAPYGE